MKKCQYCSNVMKDNDSFCSVCGKSAEVVVSQAKNKSSVPVVLIICVTLIIVIAMILDHDTEPDVTGVYASLSENTVQTATEPVTEKTTTVNTDPTTVVVVIEESGKKKNDPPRYNPPAPTTSRRTYYAGSYYYPVNTPDKAGLVLRSGASSSSVKLGVIKEYEMVSIVNENIDGGYIYVYAVDRNAYGWVLADYLAYYGSCYQPTTVAPTYSTRPIMPETTTTTTTTTRYYPTTASVNCSYGSVSYNTPNHDGINLRSSASSTSELLRVLKEGETVVVYYPLSSGDYIEISYTDPVTEETYYGWAMRKYIVW